MLHRFADPAFPARAGHDVQRIRAGLDYLRKRRFELVSLTTLFERAERRAPLNGAIAFTIDDGYLDHAVIGGRVFAEFDCPVTTFVTTGFLDGAIWFWWDKIEFVFQSTAKKQLTVPFGGSGSMTLAWSTSAERDAAQRAFTLACKDVREDDKHVAIQALARAAEIEIPDRPPAAYAPMSWSDARRCEASGMTFGPHTVTHPILARASDSQSRTEIETSWRRLSSEVAAPVPVFCYPNGDPVRDIGSREFETIDALGLKGGVVGAPGYASGDDIRDGRNRFVTPRFPMPESRGQLVQWVSGLDRLKDQWRQRRAGRRK